MEARTHIVFGESLAVLSPIYFQTIIFPHFMGRVQLPSTISIALLLSCGIGSLMPDMDHPKALLTRRVPGARTFLSAEHQLEHLPVVGEKIEDLDLHHRGPAHSLLAVLGAWFISPLLGVFLMRFLTAITVLIRAPSLSAWILDVVGTGFRFGFTLGWLSHVLIDILNTKPVYLFWPLKIPVKLFPGGLGIPVSSSLETLLRWGIMLGLVWLNPIDGILTFLVSEWLFRFVAKTPESPI